ncbi:MAG TPA: hypothetical protein VI197_02075 [Polyangiaceae bacterium]
MTCKSKKSVISQLANPAVGEFSISGTDKMNGNAPLILEFFKPRSGHPTCVGETILGTRHFYFQFDQLNQIANALDDGLTIKLKGAVDSDGWIDRVAWKAV